MTCADGGTGHFFRIARESHQPGELGWWGLQSWALACAITPVAASWSGNGWRPAYSASHDLQRRGGARVLAAARPHAA